MYSLLVIHHVIKVTIIKNKKNASGSMHSFQGLKRKR